MPLGLSGDCGVVIVGSPQPDFPSTPDRLMLGVAANQAAIVLQQHRSEARNRRSEQELADFFDNATVGLHSVGPDGTILRANRAELTMLGYPADDMRSSRRRVRSAPSSRTFCAGSARARGCATARPGCDAGTGQRDVVVDVGWFRAADLHGFHSPHQESPTFIASSKMRRRRASRGAII